MVGMIRCRILDWRKTLRFQYRRVPFYEGVKARVYRIFISCYQKKRAIFFSARIPSPSLAVLRFRNLTVWEFAGNFSASMTWVLKNMVEQLSLFQDEYVLLNCAVEALVALDFDAALTAFSRHRDLYCGNDHSKRLMNMALSLRDGIASCQETVGQDKPGRLFAFWKSFEDAPEARQKECASVMSRIRLSFFNRIIQNIEAIPLPDASFLCRGIPVGYAYIQTGQHDRAVRSLQACIVAGPDNSVVYGYLGDAYFLRGETAVARRVYLEACLIDPVTVDWDHLRDETLRNLRAELAEEEGSGRATSLRWLPSHAYVRGLFGPKRIRFLEEFKTFADGYLELRKSRKNTSSPELDAKLFLKGIILCDNEPFMRLIKSIDFAEVRRDMKAANPSLFAAYLKQIESRRSRTETPGA